MYSFKRKKPVQQKETPAYCSCSIETGTETDRREMFFQLERILKNPSREILFLCIGSDRSTGDAYGPLVGTMLQENPLPYHVIGTLSEPVHALNLENVLKRIKKQFENPLILGVDSCLGDYCQIGSLFLKEGSFSPGRAVNKVLPEVGHYHLTAVVNCFEPRSPMHSLNSTRLNTVMDLAKLTAALIVKTV